MDTYAEKAFAVFIILAAGVAAFGSATRGAPTPSRPPALAHETIACRVLEAHTIQEPQLAVVVFHQRTEADRAQLSALLRKHSDTSVEFQTADGNWHRGTVLRLKSCFGRGLLVFAASEARLTEKQDFVLRFPAD